LAVVLDSTNVYWTGSLGVLLKTLIAGGTMTTRFDVPSAYPAENSSTGTEYWDY